MITKAYVIAHPLDFAAGLTYRLQTQNGGVPKVTRDYIKSFRARTVKFGDRSLCSGFGISINVEASV